MAMATATSDFLWMFVSLLITWLFFKSMKTKSFKTSATKFQNPPSPPALPIIGHLHLVGSVLAKSLHTLANQHGPLMQIHMGASTFCVVSDATVAKEVLKTNELNFVARPRLDSSVPNVYSGSSFITAPYGAYWRFLKKLCVTRLLSTAQNGQFLHVREEEIAKLVQCLLVVSGEGGACDLNRALTALTNNVICRMVMSARCSENVDKAKEVKEIVDSVMEVQAKVGIGNIFGPLAKLDLFGYGRKLSKIFEKFDEMIEGIIREHEEKEVTENGGRDLMDILLETSKDVDAEVKLTRKDIKAVILDIFIAGTETSSAFMQWMVAELINHPEILRKVREEIDSVVGSEKRLVRDSDVPNLPYLQAVVKEGLRLHPVAPFVFRESIEDCKVNGFDVKGKTTMLISVYAIMRDPDLWTEPEEFRPERFMVSCCSNPVMKGQKFDYLPFGSGRRGCPGESLSLMVMYATIGALVQCFDWKIRGGGDKVDMQEGSGITMGMKNSLVCYPMTRFDPFQMD